MNAAWTTVLLLAVGTAVIKACGPALVSRTRLPGRVAGVSALLPGAILGALVVVDTFGSGGRVLVVDARAIGLVAATVALCLRALVLVVVVIAAGATALSRVVW